MLHMVRPFRSIPRNINFTAREPIPFSEMNMMPLDIHSLQFPSMSLLVLDIVVATVGLSLSYLLYHMTVRVPHGLQLPPGPPRHPIWGNLKDLPSGTVEYKVYEKWAKEYGQLVYLNILGRSILLINSTEMERELFNKRGTIYSGRTRTVMIHELTKFGDSTFIMIDNNEQWTRDRAILHDLISTKSAIQSFHHLLEENARSFVRRLIAEPITDLKLTRNVIGKFTMQLIYGIEVLPKDDPYLKLAERLSHNITEVVVPGAHLVDTLPILKYLPSWLPGVKFRQVADEINKSFEAMLTLPYEYARKVFNEGKSTPSFVSNYFENVVNNPDSSHYSDQVMRRIAVTLYIAGIDTLEVQTRLFFLAMALHPDAQKKAQEELDRVVGRDSLPSFADLPNLPYLNALYNEVMRWHPAGPIGLPHQLKQDDVINGYFIPKGTICIGNTWTLFRSEKEYGSDTHKFRPERFLDGSAKIKPDAAFGHGRRACPGRALAESFINIMIATILHVTDISMLEDEPLAGIIENDEFTPGVVARPRDFKCQIGTRPNAQNILSYFH